MVHGVDVGGCHDLHPWFPEIYRQRKGFLIVNIGVFIIADAVVRLPYLKIEIRVFWRFFNFEEEQRVVSLRFPAHDVHAAAVTGMIHSQGDFVTIIERAVAARSDDLLMDNAFIVEVFFGKKPFHAVGIVRLRPVRLIVIVAQ